MARSIDGRGMQRSGGARPDRVRIGEECLELDTASTAELTVLRGWVRQVNGTTFAQPYLVEDSPGRFRLYVGPAAERARTARGIQ